MFLTFYFLFVDLSNITSANTPMISTTVPIHNGIVIIHHDHAIIPSSLSTSSTTNKIPKKPKGISFFLI